jgi:hypothetical protein
MEAAIMTRSLIILNGTFEIIKKAIADNEWEKRLPYIKQMKHKILTEMSMFPRLWKLIYEENEG